MLRSPFCKNVTIVLLAIFVSLAAPLYWPGLSHFSIASGQNGATQVIDYRGYHIGCEPGGVVDDATMKNVKRQIDICEAAPVTESMRSFFKLVPITLVVEPPGPSAQSVYAGISKADKYGKITLRSGRLTQPKPVMLHELLHALHGKFIEGGFQNKTIIDFYQRAKNRLAGLGQAEAGSEYFLSNQREFFAVTASIYLFGDIRRPPFSMKNISSAMPLYAQYLEKLFAGGAPAASDRGN